MTRSVCIIQARLGSKRFPRKVLADIDGHTMLWHVVTRAKQISGVDEVVVAWPNSAEHEDDVLARYVRVAREREADVIVRVTADCPFLDPEESSAVLSKLGANDYITNRRPDTDGLDSEAMTIGALLRAHEGATTPYDREHVTPYIYGHPELFACAEYRGRSLSAKWSVDTVEDLERVRGVGRGGPG